MEFMNKIKISIILRKNFFIYFFLKIVTLALGFISNILIVRRLTVSDYGNFSLALMLIGLITTFGFSWSSSSILYYGSKEKSKTGNLNKTFWARNIIVFGSLVFVTTAFIIFKKQINDYIGLNIAYLILIWLYVSVAEDYLSQYFLAVSKQLLSTFLSITAKAIFILLVIIFEFDVKTLIVFNIISHSTVLIYSIKINRSDIGAFEFNKAHFLEIFSFSIWQLFGFSGLYLINFGDTAVIKHYMTIEDVGVYNVAYYLFNAIANLAFVISSYYASSVSHYFANLKKNKIKNFFYKERIFIITISTITHLIVMLFSKSIIIYLYGVEYAQAVLIFNILMIGSIFRYIAVFYMLYYNTNKKHKLQQSINIFRSILNLLLNIIFIQWFGLIGPAIATTLALVLTFIFSAFYCEKRIIKLCE